MFDLEVFDSSVVQNLKLRTWSELELVATMFDESTASITSDGHLVLRSKRLSPDLRSSALDVFNSIRPAGDDELLIEDGFLLKIFYRDKLYRGKHYHWKRAPSWDLKSYHEGRGPGKRSRRTPGR